MYNIFIRALAALLVAILAAIAAVTEDQCPQLSGETRQRVEQQARWLVSPSLQQRVSAKSAVFAALIRIEQCDFLSTGIIRDGDFASAGLHFRAQNHTYKSIVGSYHGIWTLGVVPDDSSTKMPEANLLNSPTTNGR
jgi:hypothetical protein